MIKSFLYLSLIKLEKININKLLTKKIDSLLLDLEDSVPLYLKEKGRQILKNKIKELKSKGIHISLRINSFRNMEGIKDLLFILENCIDLDIILLSKVESQDEVIICKENLKKYNLDKIKVYVLIENAKGILRCPEICQHADGVLFGLADYCANIGIEIDKKDNSVIEYAESMIVNSCVANGIPFFDSPFFDLKNMDALKEECIKSFKKGFLGKQAIHPKQLDIIAESFTPSKVEENWANDVITIMKINKGEITKNENALMIGPPFELLANKILSKKKE
mgnify:FL=1